MPTRKANNRRLWRLVISALLVCAVSVALRAQAPEATIQRLADINVALAEIQFLYSTSQISRATATSRNTPLEAEREKLQAQLKELPADEQQRAKQRIQGLTKARLAVLEPQWKKAAGDREAEAQGRRKAALAAVDPAVRAAMEPQRRRLTLQQRRDRGELSADEFTAADRKALDEVAAVRSNYVAQYGDRWVEQFDTRLQLQTERAFKNPSGNGSAPQNRPTTRPRSAPVGVAAPALNNGPGFGAFAVLGALLGLAALFVAYRMLSGGSETPSVSESDVYGTARFSPLLEELKDGASMQRGIFFGKSSSPGLRNTPIEVAGVPICTTPEHHTLIVARSGTGKGTRVIVPTLLRYAGSALVIDPKGENAAITGRIRRDVLGQKVFIVNPWEQLADVYAGAGFTASSYNPLDAIDRKDPNSVAIAQAMAEAVCPAVEGKDQYFQGNATALLTAVFLWLADQPGEEKTLARARELTSLSPGEFQKDVLARMKASSAFGGAIREFAGPFFGATSDAYQDVMTTLGQNMKFLSDPRVKEATRTSSFSMADLIRERATIYVVIPPIMLRAQKTWLRLLVAAGMRTFQTFAGNRPGHRCLFLIDEFPALEHMADIPTDIALMRGYGVDLALVVQGLDQLKAHYGKSSGTIISNCAYKWFCNLDDLESAKYLSEVLGKKTVGTTSRSESHNLSSRSTSDGSSTTHGETGRSLLNPDEIMNLGSDVAIVTHPHGRPHFLRTVDYWELKKAFGYLRKRYPALLWEPPLKYDPNPIFEAGRSSEPPASAPVLPKIQQPKIESRKPPVTVVFQPDRDISLEDARTLLELLPGAASEEIRANYQRLRVLADAENAEILSAAYNVCMKALPKPPDGDFDFSR
jgi:type IV secretion system protein VirD4